MMTSCLEIVQLSTLSNYEKISNDNGIQIVVVNYHYFVIIAKFTSIILPLFKTASEILYRKKSNVE